jgi:hypothetical protein
VSARRVVTPALAGLCGAEAGFRALLEDLTGFLIYRGPLEVVGSGEGEEARRRGGKRAGEEWDLCGPEMCRLGQHHAGSLARSERLIGVAWCWKSWLGRCT